MSSLPRERSGGLPRRGAAGYLLGRSTVLPVSRDETRGQMDGSGRDCSVAGRDFNAAILFFQACGRNRTGFDVAAVGVGPVGEAMWGNLGSRATAASHLAAPQRSRRFHVTDRCRYDSVME